MKWFLALVSVCAVSTFSSLAAADPATSRVIDDFSTYPVGKFPTSFRTYPLQRGKAMKVYAVAEEAGNRFLAARAQEGDGTSIFKRFDWDIARWPRLSWRWKAVTLPMHAIANDCACGIYVIFGGSNGKSIKYVWSTTAEQGKVIEYEPKKLYVIVKETGSKKVGAWQTVDVDVADDYRKLFQSDLKFNPSGIAILTDGDDTHSLSACEYDDFKISTEEAKTSADR